MNIGFIFPNKDRRYKTVHLGLGYLAAYAREHHDDLTFQVLDTRVATSKETKKFFDTSFDLIGMTVYSPVYYEVIALFNKIRKADKKVPVCFGGPYVTTIMEDIFKKTPADFAVYGEGEVTFSDLVFHLKGKNQLKDINGLMYQDPNGNIIINPPRIHISDLNTLPLPAYEIFPMERYPLHRMVTSRGCPYACSWCNSSSIWNKSKKIQILWSVSLRADIMTQELAFKMKESGCYNVAIGVESASNEILARIGKSTTIEKITQGITMMKNAGIEVLAQYVIGSPNDTLDTVKESIEYAKTSGCDYTNFYTVLPF